jgi:hypothetical protein
MAYSIANNQLLRKHFQEIKRIIDIPSARLALWSMLSTRWGPLSMMSRNATNGG